MRKAAPARRAAKATARPTPAPRARATAKAAAAPRARAKAAPVPRARAAPAAPAPRAKAAAKLYKLTAAEIRPIAPGHGACIASDKITVGGSPVRFMYREPAIHHVDSGWRFLSGLESDAYMQDASHHAFYDCNTIANYDRSIVPYLDEPIGSAFEKPPGAAEFARVTDWSPPRE